MVLEKFGLIKKVKTKFYVQFFLLNANATREVGLLRTFHVTWYCIFQ